MKEERKERDTKKRCKKIKSSVAKQNNNAYVIILSKNALLL